MANILKYYPVEELPSEPERSINSHGAQIQKALLTFGFCLMLSPVAECQRKKRMERKTCLAIRKESSFCFQRV